jgi:hypothetical protein
VLKPVIYLSKLIIMEEDLPKIEKWEMSRTSVNFYFVKEQVLV